MRVGRPRIWVLGVLFAAVAMAVVVHLYLLVVEQGSMWKERSYRNRWAFRDVPTRRGSILDRHGALLARDRPVFSLLVHYRAFRREHPLGAAVHGANLMMETRGFGADVFGFDGETSRPRDAFASLWAMPWAWMDGEVVEPDIARDLRFYVVSLVASLSGSSWSEASRDLRRLTPAPGATVAQALGPAMVERLDAAFDDCQREVDGVIALIRAETGTCSLWRVLESRRRLLQVRPEVEHVERVIERRISFPVAAHAELLSDRHPGLRTRPAVTREYAAVPGRDDLGSLRPLVGTVTPFWDEEEDREQIDEQVSYLLQDEALDQLVPRDPDLPASLVEGMAQRAHRNASSYLEVHGRNGRSGIERVKQDHLAGRPGLRLVERDRKSRETGQWGALQTSAGRDLRLSLDLELQALLELALDRTRAGEQCAIAVIDPRSGDVLAFAGRPLPPADEPMWTTPAAYWQGTGSLGSVAKPFVLLEQLDAIRKGRPHVHHATFTDCVGAYRTHGLVLSCGNHGERGKDGRYAIRESCNFFFFQAAEGLELEGVERAFWRVGLHGDDEPRAQRAVPGLVVGKAVSHRAHHILPRRAIGYGVVASTLHVARAYAALATGELPRLGFLLEDRSHLAVRLDVAEEDLDLIRDGMRACVERGTARGIPQLYNLQVLGKTGTAEISKKTGENNAWVRRLPDPRGADAGVRRGRLPGAGQRARRCRRRRDGRRVLGRGARPRGVAGALHAGGRGAVIQSTRIVPTLLRVNWWVVLAAATLALIGCAFIRSATLGESSLGGLYAKQLLVLSIAATSAVALVVIPYRRIMSWAWPLYGAALVLLLGLPLFGITVNGAQRWYRLPGFYVQPSELAKLAVVVALASYLRFRAKSRTFDGLLVPMLIAGVPALLVLRQPDLGSALVFLPVMFAMCLAAGAPVRSLLGVLAVGLLAAVAAYFVLHDYQRGRVDAWVGHFGWGDYPESDPATRDVIRGPGYQPWQSLIAIGSGGMTGFGFTEGPQNRYGFLPYRFDDYIFSVVAEETGFLGAVGLLGLHGLLVAGLLGIALRSRERFGRLLAVGVAAYFATQTLAHAAVCAWLVPATGLPMPLVSYGGSSTVVSVWMIALALNVGASREPVLAPDGFA